MIIDKYLSQWLEVNKPYYFYYNMDRRTKLYTFSLKEIKLGTRVRAKALPGEIVEGEPSDTLDVDEIDNVIKNPSYHTEPVVEFIGLQKVSEAESIALVTSCIELIKDEIILTIDIVSNVWLHTFNVKTSNRYIKLLKSIEGRHKQSITAQDTAVLFGDLDTEADLSYCHYHYTNDKALEFIADKNKITITLQKGCIDHLNLGNFVNLLRHRNEAAHSDYYELVIHQQAKLTYISSKLFILMQRQGVGVEWVIHRLDKHSFKQLLVALHEYKEFYKDNVQIPVSTCNYPTNKDCVYNVRIVIQFDEYIRNKQWLDSFYCLCKEQLPTLDADLLIEGVGGIKTSYRLFYKEPTKRYSQRIK